MIDVTKGNQRRETHSPLMSVVLSETKQDENKTPYEVEMRRECVDQWIWSVSFSLYRVPNKLSPGSKAPRRNLDCCLIICPMNEEEWSFYVG